MAGWNELRDLFEATASSPHDLEGPRRYLWPAAVFFVVLMISLTAPALGPGMIVPSLLPVIVLAAWSCGPRWTLWFSLAAAILPAFAQQWQPVEVPAGMISRLLVFLVAGVITALLRRAIDRAIEIAEHDRLTGLLNRSGFVRRLASEANRASRTETSIAVGFIDCDNFKQVNDEHGHLAGDDVLRLTALTIAENIRNYDAAARFGGDEFVVLWPVASPEGGEQAAHRLHQLLTKAMENAGWPVTFSLGVAVFDTVSDPERVLMHADSLMYNVKRTGKGAVAIDHVRNDLRTA